MSSTAQDAPASSVVLESREGAVATLTLNRPDRLNALNIELGAALLKALRAAGTDETIRCVVLTGAGRAFCAGGDIALLQDTRTRNAAHELETLVRSGKEIILAICDMPKPVVAMINGPAAGGGMNLALACDLRLASDQASFGQSFAKLGLFPDFGGTFFLPRLAGAAYSAEMFWTGEMIHAAEAERVGLVNHLVPHRMLEEETRTLAARLAAAPPLAMRAVKQLLFAREREELERALEYEVQQQVRCFLSQDCAEGLRAFLEKRKPVFKGS